MLEGSSDQTKGAGKWVTRLGSVLWVIVEAAVPDSLAGHFFVHVVALLFWVEAVIFVGGAFFNQPLEMVGLKLLVITGLIDRKSTRLNSSHLGISYAVFCLK